MNSVTAFVVGFALYILVAIGCTPADHPMHAYTEGDCVQMKIDGRQGMVINPKLNRMYVRFSGGMVTPLFQKGKVYIRPYTTLSVSYFEVEPCSEEGDD